MAPAIKLEMNSLNGSNVGVSQGGAVAKFSESNLGHQSQRQPAKLNTIQPGSTSLFPKSKFKFNGRSTGNYRVCGASGLFVIPP